METRGQAALDLLLSLVILLVVLASMGGVLSSYTDTQKEISLHQQLDEQSRLTALFLGIHSQRAHGVSSFPTGGSLSSADVVGITNEYIHSTGAFSLSPVRISGYPQGVPCTIAADLTSGAVSFSTLGVDAGLASSVSADSSFVSSSGFDNEHDVDTDGCGDFVVLEEA